MQLFYDNKMNYFYSGSIPKIAAGNTTLNTDKFLQSECYLQLPNWCSSLPPQRTDDYKAQHPFVLSGLCMQYSLVNLGFKMGSLIRSTRWRCCGWVLKEQQSSLIYCIADRSELQDCLIVTVYFFHGSIF